MSNLEDIKNYFSRLNRYTYLKNCLSCDIRLFYNSDNFAFRSKIPRIRFKNIILYFYARLQLG